MTVGSVIPYPTKDVVDIKQVAEYSDSLKKRIMIISDYTRPQSNVFSLAKLLSTATWGRYHPLSDLHNKLCNPTTGDPLTVWIVGNIVNTWFMKGSKPDRKASVTIAPLSRSLGIQTTKLLAKLSFPPLRTLIFYFTLLKAVKWQSEKGDSKRKLFSAVYDASEVLLPKAEMAYYNPIDLKTRDLVLIETRITRYKSKDNDNKWTVQRAQLELLAINLLYSAPATQDGEESRSANIDENLRI
ncbi:hypothetical protein PAXRUDRAFT_788621 [Paxillus rubicundulus Ve08.2h10]|uniref:Unplaced genomic scaffold scaffold_3703, whole genome shotgun sequence n=1 Tax=Paxillus rubicundulus Ve08.2h10 TaxID=930991 RepID=A0A0D0CUQ5_9AGAM|nr:hypothetical protein PAXRUDRAFT_788621 [Paxillus rubicundulus Ve08.2h10]